MRSPESVGRVAMALAAIMAFVSASCGHRVDLVVPSPDAPIEDRRAAFTRYRPVGTGAVIATDGGTRRHTFEYLELADGTKVYAAADLLPAVAPDSRTARLVAESNHYSAAGGITMGAGFGGVGLGIGLIALGASEGISGLPETGVALGLASLLTALIAPFVLWGISNRRNFQAFKTYEADMVRFLRLTEPSRQ